ncbi:MAG: VCBS domain-containing protein, partial [Hylemonella sp.]
MAVSTVSYTNTPQAGDDYFSISEDQTGIIKLDVMSNDLGGKAKTLYSVDDGVNLSDLLQKDTRSYTGLDGGWELSANGNWIRINNGMIEFKFGGTCYDYLAEGVKATDSFKYAIQLGNGTISYATVNLTFVGTNDLATITVNSDFNVTEAGGVNNSVKHDPDAGGTVTVSDADTGQSKLQNADQGTHAGKYGTFTITESTSKPGVYTWKYELDNGLEATQALQEGELAYDTLTLTSVDGKTTQDIKVTINGTNDAATFSGSLSGSASETNAAVTITGTASASDVDNAAGFQAQTLTGTNGSLSIDAAGAWTFTANSAFDSLNVG